MSDLYAEIVRTTQALIVVLDADGRVVMFNPACERASGYRFEEVQGLPVWDFLLLQEEIDGVKAVFADLRAGHFPNTYGNHWITKSGEHRSIEWSNSAVTDESGRVVHVIATGIDVTEKRSVEAALRNAEQRQRALLDGIPDAAWLVDADSRYIAVNRSYAERWGIDQSNVIGKSVLEVFPGLPGTERIEENREVMRAGTPLHIERRRVIDGREYWLEVRKVPIADGTGDVIGMACISRDISERKLAEAQRLARDAGLRASLIQEVHHRIKNNLQGVITFIQQLASGHPENAGLVDAAIARLNAISSVHGLFGTFGENDHRLEQILLSLVSSLKVVNGDLPIRLSIRSEPQSVRVIAGEIVPLALVINELIMNAVKHTRGAAGGDPVEIVLESIGDRATIAISTHSGRFPAQFDFAAGAGLGTGLALVKSLLPPAGAELRFENSADSAGTIVELTLRPPVINSLPWQAS